MAGLLLILGGCDSKIPTNIDRTPPEVSITSPITGAGVSGVSFVLEVTATDDVDVDRVEVVVNGEPGPTDTTEPYRLLVFTIASPADNVLSVTARAFDTSENSAATSIAVTVSDTTVTQLTFAAQDDMNPSWSPDGTRLVFQARRPEGHFDLWTMNADGSSQTRLTANTNEDRNPAWSPAGDEIAFDSNRAGSFDIWVLPLAGGEAAADSLTFGNLDNMEPGWTADASAIYFTSNRGDNAPFNIWWSPADGGAHTQVTSFVEPDISPALSPDGLYLAFVSPLNFDEPKVHPSWDPTSTALLYSRVDGTGSQVWGVPLLGGAPTQITSGSGPIVGDGGAVMSPDASRIAFHSDRNGNLDIYVLE
jgi:TolB protein